MSPKARTVYRCTVCGADTPRWAGRCAACGEWNSLVEEIVQRAAPATGRAARRADGLRSLGAGGIVSPVAPLRDVGGSESHRWRTGIGEFDFVLGGGVVPGSVVLVGGEPGVGKSTLLLQVAATLRDQGHETLYVSGEESPLQVKLRADRLGAGALDVALLSETNLETVLATAAGMRPAAMVVDSIQTVYTADLEGAPGNVGQVRECAARLMHFAKQSGTTVFLVGHVTKGGGIAGPKTLEHIVDTVLYFEGDTTLEHRVLRATKNRFGSVDEIGVFRMTQAGLEPVPNPSELFLGDRSVHSSGSAITALVEGSRPVLVEVQGLATKAGFGTPQRVATGFDSRRLALLLAVLDKRAGIPFGALDVFINVAGGVRMVEPGGDLAVAAALASSVHDVALPADAVFFGEVGLGGEIRAASQMERRLGEAAKLGMKTAFVAARARGRTHHAGLHVVRCGTLSEMFEKVFR